MNYCFKSEIKMAAIFATINDELQSQYTNDTKKTSINFLFDYIWLYFFIYSYLIVSFTQSACMWNLENVTNELCQWPKIVTLWTQK